MVQGKKQGIPDRTLFYDRGMIPTSSSAGSAKPATNHDRSSGAGLWSPGYSGCLLWRDRDTFQECQNDCARSDMWKTCCVKFHPTMPTDIDFAIFQIKHKFCFCIAF